MDCNLTSIERAAAPRRSRQAFTLVEFAIVSGIGMLLMIVVASMIFFSARSFAAMANYVDLENSSRLALDRMTREIRQVDGLITAETNRLVFMDSDSTQLEYVYSPNNRTLTRIKGGVSEVILSECDALSFSIFQRNPIGGTYDQYPTATPSTAKLIQLNWVCSREILGKKANTESVQTAKIVIRNQ